MIPRFILPTSEIIRTFKAKEELFEFYEEGIRGLVRDIVMRPRAFDTVQICDGVGYNKDAMILEELVAQVVSQYENSLHYRYIENTRAHIHPSCLVEVVVLCVEDAVSQMLRGFFAGFAYDVCKSNWQWLEDDLVVTITFQRDACEKDPSFFSLVASAPCRTGIYATSWYGASSLTATSSF